MVWFMPKASERQAFDSFLMGQSIPRNQCRLRNPQRDRLRRRGTPQCYDPTMVTEKGIPKIAYFCMEIALDPSIPSYGGGLGILAGDMLRSAADLELPMVAISLAYHNGY